MKLPKPLQPVQPLVTLLCAILLASCATTMVSGGKADFCAVAKAIYWSDKDTAETVAQVKEHNAVGKTLCGWGQ